MNTPNINASSANLRNNVTGASSNRKESPSEKNQIQTNELTSARQTKSANQAAVVTSFKHVKQTDDSVTTKKTESEEVSAYLKMISRFENQVKLDEIEKEDLEILLKALNDQILALNDYEKDRLKASDFFTTNKITNLEDLSDKLTEMFNSEVERDGFFDFLKSPEFMRILLEEPIPNKGYSPQKIQQVTNTRPPTADQPSKEV